MASRLARTFRFRSLALVAVLLAAAAANAGSPREQALADFLADAARDAELVWLDAAGSRFFAFHRRAARPDRALLIVPGPEAFADAKPLVHALAAGPVAGGWSTLALQMPLLERAASAEPAGAAEAGAPAAVTNEAAPVCARLRAGIDHLRAAGAVAIAAVALGEHAGPTLDCLADAPPAGLVGVAVLGRWTSPRGELPAPLLELVPGLDAAAVRLAGTRERRWLAVAPASYRQDRLPGVGAGFAGAEEEAAKRVRGWLDRRTAGGPALH